MIPVKVLAVRYLANAAPALCRQLGAPEGYPSLGLLTTDCDDATYIALDAATKAAQVQVAYARSFYAGAANATTPFAGEVIGILAAQTPGAVRSGMEAALAELERVGFEDAAGGAVPRPHGQQCGLVSGKGSGGALRLGAGLSDCPAIGGHVRHGRGAEGGGRDVM